MTKYEIILYRSDEDQAFVAEVPELAWCVADGLTRQPGTQGPTLVRLSVSIRSAIQRRTAQARPSGCFPASM